MKPIRRLFDASAATLVETARTIHGLLTSDIADFSAYSTRFASPNFLADFEAQIDAAEDAMQDIEVVGDIGVQTAAVNVAMAKARSLCRRVKNHAVLAFGNDDPAALRRFTRGYGTAARQQAQMILFLEALYGAMIDYQTELADPNKGGMPATLPDQVLAAQEQLKEANAAQELAISQRAADTQQRTRTLNACYQTIVMINNTAQVIYEDDPAKRRQYVFYKTDSTRDSVYEGSVAPGETRIIASLPFDGGRYISFENRGAVGLDFDLSTDQSTFDGNIVDLDGGARLEYPMNWLNAEPADGDAVNLLVRNTNATVGQYWVSVSGE